MAIELLREICIFIIIFSPKHIAKYFICLTKTEQCKVLQKSDNPSVTLLTVLQC